MSVNTTQLHSASLQSKEQGISLFLWLFCSAGMKQEGEDNTTSAQATLYPQITTLAAKRTHTHRGEAELGGLSLPSSNCFDLSKTWQSSINSHHAMHFGRSVVRCQVVSPLLCLLIMIKTVAPEPIPILFFSSPPKRLPVPDCLLSFIS